VPDLREVHEALKDTNAKLLAVNITASDKMADLEAMVASENIQYPVLLDQDGKVSGQYGIRSIPTAVIIDKDGTVAEHRVGAYGKEELLKKLEENR